MEADPPAEESRPPGRADLISLCQALNEQKARYLVVGGMAVVQQGFLRATEGIDLLIDGSPENVARVRRALDISPDQAIREMGEHDLEQYTVVRVADEIVVDLMLRTCGIAYEEATDETEWITLDSVPIPFASARLLLRMKQTTREKDALDRLFLEQKLADQNSDSSR